MPRFQIIATQTITISQTAVTEIEAESQAEALARAREMDQDGELPWRDDNRDQLEPTEYTAEPITTTET